jgi:hypothetical protein
MRRRLALATVLLVLGPGFAHAAQSSTETGSVAMCA